MTFVSAYHFLGCDFVILHKQITHTHTEMPPKMTHTTHRITNVVGWWTRSQGGLWTLCLFACKPHMTLIFSGGETNMYTVDRYFVRCVLMQMIMRHNKGIQRNLTAATAIICDNMTKCVLPHTLSRINILRNHMRIECLQCQLRVLFFSWRSIDTEILFGRVVASCGKKWYRSQLSCSSESCRS